MLKSFVAKSITLPVAAACGLITTKLAIEHLGPSGYALVALFLGIAGLLPFADLGIGAGVTDTVAKEPKDSPQIARMIRKGYVWLFLVGAVIVFVGAAVTVIGGWPRLLGLPPTTPLVNASGFAVVGLFALSLPAALGHRVLLGAGRNELALLVQVLPSVLNAVGAALLAWLDAPPLGFLCVLGATPLVGGLVASWVAQRVSGIPLRSLARPQRFDRWDDSSFGHVATWAFVISLALPIAYQTDRYIISHVVGLNAVTQYAIAGQLYAPALALLSATAMPLWPRFARGAGAGADLSHLVRVTMGFFGASAVLGSLLVLLGPPVATYISDGEGVPRGLFFAFALLLCVHGSFMPIGMYFMNSGHVRFQALATAAMAIANLILSIFLATRIGLLGPVLGSAIAIMFCMWVPMGLRLIATHASTRTPDAISA